MADKIKQAGEAGVEALSYFTPIYGDLLSAKDSVEAAKAAQKAERFRDKAKLYGLSGLAAAGALPGVSAFIDAGGPAVKRMINKAIAEAEKYSPQPQVALPSGGVMNMDEVIDMGTLKMGGGAGASARGIKISEQRQYVNKKLQEIWDAAPKNEKGEAILSADWYKSADVKKQIYDSNPNLFPEWKDGVGQWNDLTSDFLAGKFIKVKGKRINTGDKVNSVNLPVSKATAPFEKATLDFKKEVSKKLNVDSLNPQDPTFKYLNFIRLSESDDLLKNSNKFFKKYKFEDLNIPGTKLNKNFEKFKVLENKRIQLRDDPAIQSLIQKIIPDENVTFQIAHTFEGGQIRKGRVSKSKQGKGGDPDEMYIDLSTINVSKKKGMQKDLENKARELEKLYTETGDRKLLEDIKKISERMDALGVEGQTVTQVGDLQSGFILGSKDVKFSTKLETLAKDRGIELTPDDYAIMLKADNIINPPKEIMQGTVELKNRGGIVGISHLIRPL
jgi:hypothetical protein